MRLWRTVQPLLDPLGLLHLKGAVENTSSNPMPKEKEETSAVFTKKLQRTVGLSPARDYTIETFSVHLPALLPVRGGVRCPPT